MECSNDILAKGVTFLALKIVNKKSVAKDYSPELLASMLRKSATATRSLDEVICNLFLLCIVSSNKFTIFTSWFLEFLDWKQDFLFVQFEIYSKPYGKRD